MFELLHRDSGSRARCGRLTTAHGVLETPVFMPVGTQGSVKSVSPDELKAMGAQIILGNTYHLFVRPGMEVIEHFEGLHNFSSWDGPILTDSGGFQVFSLAKLRKITEEGVRFQNHLDGSPTFLSPEISMQIQRSLGSDIAMVFDECPPFPCLEKEAAESLDLTLRWAHRCREWKSAHPSDQMHFGIVQGSVYPSLREKSARALVEMDWDGYAVGGVSVGEPEEEMYRAIENSEPYLPQDRPRYAMGLGTPPQMLEIIARGVDMFDCVLPTRVARNGTAYTRTGTINLRNQQYEKDRGPIEENCDCPACSQFSRGYLRHLVKAREILGLRLVTLHNLHFYLRLMEQARWAIENGSFARFREEFTTLYQEKHN